MKRREFVIGTLAAMAFPKHLFASSPSLIVNRTESCGCCGAWVKKMALSGFRTEVNLVTHDALMTIKSQLGISEQLSSCHTATINDYFIEGHVPAEDIWRLLEEKPQARGLSVPGMPIGSPGMEMGNSKEPFNTVILFKNGRTAIFNKHL